jgi:PilZ domain
MAEERRQYERIYCYLIARHAPGGTEEEDFFGRVRNISEGGGMLETDQPVSVGSQLNLTFVQDEGRQIWEGTGKVVWVRTQGGKNVLGIQFDDTLEKGVMTALR